jgi:transitional endoplasmic reticulum ATPase
MTFQAKPKLYNGFKIADNLFIKKRIERAYFVEIYELSDNNFLYLIMNRQPEQIEHKVKNLNHIRIKIDDSELLGIIVPAHSVEKISNIIERLDYNRGFACVAGMHGLKQLLIRDIIRPILNPEEYQKFKLSIPNGILLYGPPGCGKTFIVRKLAEELNYHFIEVNHQDISSSFIHESASKIAEIFEKGKINAPTIIFFDEIEGIVPKRENLGSISQYKQEEVNEFLRQLNDAGKHNILVVGASNMPHLIDPAILRSGRIDKKIYVPLPDLEARKELFKLYLVDRPHVKTINFNKLATISDGFTCSDIEFIVSESARVAIDQNKSEIDEEIIETEIVRSSASITLEEIEQYKKFDDNDRTTYIQ